MKLKKTINTLLAPVKTLGLIVAVVLPIAGVAALIGWGVCGLNVDPAHYCGQRKYIDLGLALLLVPAVAVILTVGVWAWVSNIRESYREDVVRSTSREVGAGHLSAVDAAGGELSSVVDHRGSEGE